MRWFGASWGAPVCEDTEHVPTPVGELCGGCERPVMAGDQGLVLLHYEEIAARKQARWFPVHLDCLRGMIKG